MSIFATCNPSPFDDPTPDVDRFLEEMVARVNGEENLVRLNATEYEKKRTHLKRFLKKFSCEVPAALADWSEWVQWRRGTM